MVWQVVAKGAAAAGKGAAKGTAAVGKGAAKGAAKVGQAAAKGAGKAGKSGAKGAAKGAGKGAQQAGKAGKGGLRAGKGGLDARALAQARRAARAGKDGSRAGDGSGGGKGKGPLGKGGKPKGWAGKALQSARAGPGGRGASGLVDGGGVDGAGAGEDAAGDASEALKRFVRGRLRRRRGPFKKTRRRVNRLFLAATAVMLAAPLMLATWGEDAASDQVEAVMAMQCSGAPPDLMSEATGIPIDAVNAYCSAAVDWQVDWSILAAIGKKECDHGRNRDPGCDPGPPHTVNGAGARGPMQFLGSTWRSSAGTFDLDVAGPPIPRGQEAKGYATDGDDDGLADPWTFTDATHAAARYLLANGLADDQHKAIYAYNHSDEYVADVQRIAADYKSKVKPIMDQEDLAAAGGSGGALALGCPASPSGSTAPVPAGNNTIATQQMANTLIKCFGRNGKDVGCYNRRPQSNGQDGPYEHPRGRACDLMMTSGGTASGNDRARGEAMAQYAMTHARELKIIYIIWFDKVWWNGRDAVKPWSQWRSYGCDGGDPSTCHYNHVHVSVHLQPGDPSLAQCKAGIPCTP